MIAIPGRTNFLLKQRVNSREEKKVQNCPKQVDVAKKAQHTVVDAIFSLTKNEILTQKRSLRNLID